MKKLTSLVLALCLAFCCAFALAEEDSFSLPDITAEGEPPAPPDEMGTPPEGRGTPPGGMGGPGGPGGQSFSGEYTAVVTADGNTTVDADLVSTGTDENALLVTAGETLISGVTVTRTSADSTGGDNASFYGVGAALLATGGTLRAENLVIESDAAGGAGVFSYGDGTVYISDSTIHTTQGTSGGIHVAGGGTLYADNVTAVTNGASSAAIRSDRGGGTMVVTGGSSMAR